MWSGNFTSNDTQGEPTMADEKTAAAANTVTIDNFVRAETDNYFRNLAKPAGGIGRWMHIRQPTPLDQQTVIRMNLDTLYSTIVLDLTEPATIVLPDAGGRFLSMMVVNEDHYITQVAYAPGRYTLTADNTGTRYAAVLLRTFMDSKNPQDVQAANALQDRTEVIQAAAGVLDVPEWDQASLAACRAAIAGLADFLPDKRRMFGAATEVDPIRHLFGTAIGWGGNQDKDAVYVMETVPQNDGKTPYELKVKDVPMDGFWSITVYNAEGFMDPKGAGANALNNVTAKPNADGSYTVRFGGDPAAENYLYIMPGWNYTVRLYRPRAAILDGTWQFPLPVAVG
jgi:hypothetical protein